MAKIQPEVRAVKFIETRKTVNLSTKNKMGELWGSYSPFVYHNGHFYVGVNYIAQHTKDMLETSEICAFFRADEAGAGNLYALERFAVRCLATAISEGDAEWKEVIPLFEAKFGKQFEFARQLKDFFLFRLELLEAGRYVRGFGSAYDVAPDFKSAKHVQDDHINRGEEPKQDDDKKD